ncbi:MAG: hypothetical protein KGO96_10625 [Elusimicrobia bacterium]|nr:hypothetical protein [Elusimicrobiota bacterium]
MARVIRKAPRRLTPCEAPKPFVPPPPEPVTEVTARPVEELVIEELVNHQDEHRED